MKRALFGLLAVLVIAVPALVLVEPVWATPSSTNCTRLGGTWNPGSSGWHCDGAKTSSTWQENSKANASDCQAFGGKWNAGSSGWTCSGATFSGTWTTGGNGDGSGSGTGTGSGSGSSTGSGSGSGSSTDTGGGTPTVVSTGSTVSTNKCGGVSTSLINCSDSGDGSAIFDVLAIALNVVTYGVGAAAIFGVVVTGYQYMTARDNSAQVAKAKNRLLQVVIGLIIWVLFWGVLQFLLPGGLFANGS